MTPPDSTERFLTVTQVADAMQVHLDTVRIWLRTGRLRGVKVGRSWRVPERELTQLAIGSTPEAANAAEKDVSRPITSRQGGS